MPAITDRMIYIVVCGNILPERDTADLDRKTTVQDIAAGQFEGVTQILECNPVEGTCRNVSEDIAREVMEIWADEDEALQDWQHSFVELFVSVTAANSFRRAA